MMATQTAVPANNNSALYNNNAPYNSGPNNNNAPYNNSAPNNNAAQSQGTSSGGLTINIRYFATVGGILKIIQMIFGIICLATASPALIPGTHWFLFVAAVSFIATILWSFAYLFGVREVVTIPVNWLLLELIITLGITILYIIGFIVQLVMWSKIWYSFYKASNIAAGCFGLFNTIAYAAGTFFLFMEHRGSSTASPYGGARY